MVVSNEVIAFVIAVEVAAELKVVVVVLGVDVDVEVVVLLLVEDEIVDVEGTKKHNMISSEFII